MTTVDDLRIGQEWKAIGDDAHDGWSITILGISGDELLFNVVRPGVTTASPPVRGSVSAFLDALEQGRWKPAHNGLQRAIERIKE